MLSSDTAQTVSAQTFRRAMSRLPTSITVAATMIDEEPVGMIIGTFTSISLDPPIVGFFGDHRSSTFRPLLKTGTLAFSVLQQGARDVCGAFRRVSSERFRDIEWSLSEQGNPIIPGSALVVEGGVLDVHTVGDHDLVTVLVTAATVPDIAPRPLVFHDRRLEHLDPTLVSASSLTFLDWSD